MKKYEAIFAETRYFIKEIPVKKGDNPKNIACNHWDYIGGFDEAQSPDVELFELSKAA